MGMIKKLTIAVVLLAVCSAAIWFAVENSQAATVNVYSIGGEGLMRPISLPLYQLLFLTFLLGALLSSLLFLVDAIRLRWQVRRLEKSLRRAKEEAREAAPPPAPRIESGEPPTTLPS